MRSKRNSRELILEQLVMDSSRFGFNEQEALSYIESRAGGRGIARSRYYEIKKSLSESEMRNCKERMIYHTKAGFVVNHFRRMDEIEHLQSMLFKTLHNEISKPVNEQSPFAISKIATNIAINSRLLVEMNIGSPIIEQMKAEIHKRLDNKGKVESNKEDDYGIVPPSALTLPEGYLDASLYATDDGGGMATGKKSSDRVF